MQLHIGKLTTGMLLLSVLGVLGTTSAGASATYSDTLSLKSGELKATEVPSVQLPVEEAAIDVPLPTEELALGYGYFGRYYGGY